MTHLTMFGRWIDVDTGKVRHVPVSQPSNDNYADFGDLPGFSLEGAQDMGNKPPLHTRKCGEYTEFYSYETDSHGLLYARPHYMLKDEPAIVFEHGMGQGKTEPSGPSPAELLIKECVAAVLRERGNQ